MKFKKFISIVALLNIIFMLFSCSDKKNIDNIDIQTELLNLDDNIDMQVGLLNLDDNYNLVALYDNNIILSKDEWCKDENGNYVDVKDYTFYKYNLSNSHLTTLLRLDRSGTGTGDYLIMNEELLINSTLIQEESPYNLLFNINLRKGELNEVARTELFPPFQFLTQLNDNEVVIYEPNKNYELENGYEYNIKKYDVLTGEINKLKTTNYDFIEMTGTLINSVFCTNNKMFALTIKNSENFYVEIYDENGNFLDEIFLEELAQYLDNIEDII